MKRILSIREVPIFLVFVAFFTLAAIGNHRLFSASGAHDIMFGSSVFALLISAETLIIVMKHIDLSISSTIGFSSYLIGKASEQGHGLVYCLAIGIGIGLVIGAVNGALVAYFELPSLVVTLATLYLVRGIFNQIVGGDFINSDKVPHLLSYMSNHEFLSIPYLFIVALVVCVCVAFYM